MRLTAILCSAALLLVPSALADSSKMEVRDLPNHPLLTDLPAGTRVRLYLRAGDVDIRSRDDNKVTVRYDGHSPVRFKDLSVRFERSADSASVALRGGPDRDMRVVIELPRDCSLFVRMSAGNLEVARFAGDQDISLRAGNLDIAMGDPHDYSRIHASVVSGGLEAAPLGESHGGLFRSFSKEGPGRLKLSAHVTAGDLTLH
jgi:hypothetical protein